MISLVALLAFTTLYLHLDDSSASNIQGQAANNTFTLAYTLSWNQEWLVGRQIGSAIILGIEEVYRRNILPGYQIEWTWRDSYCQPNQGTKMIVDMWNSMEDLDAIIGDGCSVVCQPAALLAAAWGIPIISWGCTSASLSDKVAYPTFTRVHGTWLNLGPVFYHMSALFEWDTVAIITVPEDIWKLTAEAIRNEMEHNGKTVHYRVIQTTVRGDVLDMDSLEALRETIDDLKTKVHIFFILTYPSDIRNVLLVSMEQGLLNGEYAFVTIETLIALQAERIYRPHIGRSLYNGLLGIVVPTPSGPKYEYFQRRVIQAFDDPHFENEPHLTLNNSIQDVHPYAGN